MGSKRLAARSATRYTEAHTRKNSLASVPNPRRACPLQPLSAYPNPRSQFSAGLTKLQAPLIKFYMLVKEVPSSIKAVLNSIKEALNSINEVLNSVNEVLSCINEVLHAH